MLAERQREELEEAAAELAEARGELASAESEVARRWEQADFDLPERPEGEEPDDDIDGVLYDSRRHWLDQLEAFRAARRFPIARP